MGNVPPPLANQGIWSTYGLASGPPLAPDGSYPGQPTFFYYTTNGVTNPTLHMRPGEVQRWRLLNATDSDNLLITLQGHGLNVIAMDGITVGQMYRLQAGRSAGHGAGPAHRRLGQGRRARHLYPRNAGSQCR
jgi:FtsP/CotA-like multicopper oxidase with cupredoxin domain